MDPVTLAVVRGSLEQIADEMDLQLIHAAISPIISETNDCANGIFHPETGETIAQGRYGLPVFLAYMQFAVQHIIALAREQGGFKPGDIWIMNDTYVGGSHLQDVQLVAPILPMASCSRCWPPRATGWTSVATYLAAGVPRRPRFIKRGSSFLRSSSTKKGD